MSDTGSDAAKGADERHVFQRFDRGKATGAGVDGGSAGEGCAKMFEVTRPWIGRVWVEKAFEMSYVALVTAVLAVGVEGSGIKLGDVFRFEMNDATHRVGSGFQCCEIAGDPVGCHGGVGVSGKDGGVWMTVEAVKRCIHEQTAGGADVSFFGEEGAFGQIKMEVGMSALVGVDYASGVVGAIVEEDDHFVKRRVKRAMLEVNLEAKSFECGGEGLLLVAGGDDDCGSASGVSGGFEARG